MPIREFAYIDAAGTKARHAVAVSREDDRYLYGYCHYARGPRTYRKDRIQFDIDETITSELLNEYPPVEPAPPKPRGPRKPKDDRMQICFTGFDKADRDFLTAKATKAGMATKSSVTKKLSFLVTGWNAGPSKIAKAKDQGVNILTEEAFFDLIDTGVLPDISTE